MTNLLVGIYQSIYLSSGFVQNKKQWSNKKLELTSRTHAALARQFWVARQLNKAVIRDTISRFYM